MGEHLPRRSFIGLAATTSSVVVIGFDPRARSWITQARADTGPWEDLPKLDGTLLQDEVSRQASAVDWGNMFSSRARCRMLSRWCGSRTATRSRS